MQLKMLVAAASCALSLAAGPAGAQTSTTANGPYYAMPSWSQKLTTGRFVVLSNWGNQAVLDRETGLVWHRSFGQANTLPEAFEACLFSATGGRRGWRLSTMPELLSLVESESGNSILPAGHPFEAVPLLPFLPSSASFFTATQSLVSVFAGAAYRLVGFGKSSQGTVVIVNGQLSPQNPFAPNGYLCVRGGDAERPM